MTATPLATLNPAQKEALKKELPQSRWFRSKGNAILDLNVLDSLQITSEKSIFSLLILQVVLNNGHQPTYFLPVSLENKTAPKDVFSDTLFQKWVIQNWTKGVEVATVQGKIIFKNRQLSPLPKNCVPTLFQNISAEQSNSSFVFNQQTIIKFYRQIEAETNCEIEMLDYFLDHSFQNAPRLEGEVYYQNKLGETFTLGVATQFYPGSLDGWNYLMKLFHDSKKKSKTIFEESLTLMADLGQTTAKMHSVLCDAKNRNAFQPEPIQKEDLNNWLDAFKTLLANLSSDLRHPPQLGFSDQERLKLIWHNQNLILQKAEKLLAALPTPSYKIRCHGDFHLGQTLKTPGPWVVIDFEGEPMRSAAHKREKYSPLKDVAGMLRSLDYLVQTLIKEGVHGKEDLDCWHEKARSVFLSHYFVAPLSVEKQHPLLDFFELEKAFYELNYELHNRPAWLLVPLGGIERLLPRL